MTGLASTSGTGVPVPQPTDVRRLRIVDGSPAARQDAAVHELCHDLRQPVAAIAAVVAATQLEADVSPALRTRLEQIAAEARTISELCHQALGETREPSAVRVDTVVTEVVQGALLTYEGTITMQAEPAVVEGTRAALRRAVWNIVDNAGGAAGPAGRVAVDVHNNAREVVVVVADSGPGFGRTQTGSTGLGLGIARRIAAEHGGRLVVGHSNVLGGAVVSLALPRSTADPVPDPT